MARSVLFFWFLFSMTAACRNREASVKQDAASIQPVFRFTPDGTYDRTEVFQYLIEPETDTVLPYEIGQKDSNILRLTLLPNGKIQTDTVFKFSVQQKEPFSTNE